MSVPPQLPEGPSIWRHVYAGTSLAFTILLCVFIGIWIDKHGHLRPWGTLGGAAVGIAVGFYNFFQEFLRDETPTKRP